MYRQASLFGDAPPAFDDSFGTLRRLDLDAATWLDHAPNWLRGADSVYDALVERLPWRHKEVWMYGRLLPEPRLSCWWTPADGAPPLAVLDDVGAALGDRYGVGFDSIGFNWYRDGNDSVAWHADTKGSPTSNPTIAIVSVGARRPFRIRPRSGGTSTTFQLGEGDLIVMGGACQHDWEHTVPKARRAGPRISITYRHSGVH